MCAPWTSTRTFAVDERVGGLVGEVDEGVDEVAEIVGAALVDPRELESDEPKLAERREVLEIGEPELEEFERQIKLFPRPWNLGMLTQRM